MKPLYLTVLTTCNLHPRFFRKKDLCHFHKSICVHTYTVYITCLQSPILVSYLQTQFHGRYLLVSPYGFYTNMINNKHVANKNKISSILSKLNIGVILHIQIYIYTGCQNNVLTPALPDDWATLVHAVTCIILWLRKDLNKSIIYTKEYKLLSSSPSLPINPQYDQYHECHSWLVFQMWSVPRWRQTHQGAHFFLKFHKRNKCFEPN